VGFLNGSYVKLEGIESRRSAYIRSDSSTETLGVFQVPYSRISIRSMDIAKDSHKPLVQGEKYGVRTAHVAVGNLVKNSGE
jgi:hypothetical protein